MSELEIVVSAEELKKKLNLKDGAPGPKGDRGEKGESVVGPPGEPGKDGSPDTPEDIIRKLKGKLSYKSLKDKPDIAGIARKITSTIASRDYDLRELKDVDVSAVTTNQSLKWNGTKWVPYTPTDVGGVWGAITGTLSAQTDLQTALDAKQNDLTLTTTGTSGTATLVGNTLNIPNYSTAPGGSDTQVQFNDGGTFGGDSGLLYNKTTNSLTTDQVIVKSGGSSSSLALKFGSLSTGFYAPTSGSDRIEVVINGGNPMDILATHLAVAGFQASTFSAGLTVSGGSLTVGSLGGLLKGTAGVVSVATGGTDYIVPNAVITGDTKTKITYDAKGLVTAGADATTADIADSLNKRYVTDAQLTVIGNTSGTNSGDQTSIVGITGTKAEFDTAVSDGNFLYVGDITQYTDEMAQDAVGNAVGNGLDYDDTSGAISVDETELTHNSLGGLTSGDPHTQYALLAGRAGGQVLYGGTAANENIAIRGTSHATKTTSYVTLQPDGGIVGIGTSTPTNSNGTRLHVEGSITLGTDDWLRGLDSGGTALGIMSVDQATGDTLFNCKTTGNMVFVKGGSTEIMRVVGSSSNVGIGGTPNARAVLDLQSTTKAFMPPRMTTTQRDNITGPTAGMVIYNSTDNVLNFYNGSAWGAV